MAHKLRKKFPNRRVVPDRHVIHGRFFYFSRHGFMRVVNMRGLVLIWNEKGLTSTGHRIKMATVGLNKIDGDKTGTYTNSQRGDGICSPEPSEAKASSSLLLPVPQGQERHSQP